VKILPPEAAAERLLRGMPEATIQRAGDIVQDFIDRRISGQVTVVLNFQEGSRRPSELGIHERGLGERRAVGEFRLTRDNEEGGV
jgi:hypothetical protein